MLNILLAGVGGQGTVLASKIIAGCAIGKGVSAHTAETIGMAQRGGSVVSHVRIGEGVFSPLIVKGTADVIIGFEPAEAVRALPYLKKGGAVVVSSLAVKPVADSLNDSGYNAADMLDYLKAQPITLITVDGAEIIEKCGSAKSLNIALLGAAASSGLIGITVPELENAVTNLSPKFRVSNLAALEAGAAYANKFA